MIAATNRDLAEMVLQKKFREDLYYRISVLTMRLPQLSERGDDVELLIRHFIAVKNQALKLNIQTISPEAISYLRSLPYPGNIRQLSNVVERAMVLCKTDVLDLQAAVEAVSARVPSQEGKMPGLPENVAIHTIQEETIRRALQNNGGNRAKTAEELGISSSTLYRRMRSLDIQYKKGNSKSL